MRIVQCASQETTIITLMTGRPTQTIFDAYTTIVFLLGMRLNNVRRKFEFLLQLRLWSISH